METVDESGVLGQLNSSILLEKMDMSFSYTLLSLVTGRWHVKFSYSSLHLCGVLVAEAPLLRCAPIGRLPRILTRA